MAQLMRSSLNRSSLVVNYLRSSIRTFSTPTNPHKQTTEQNEPNPNVILSTRTHKVNDLERKLLVMFKKYNSKEEVPTYVNQDVVEKVRNKFRIRVANIMMLLTMIGCILMVISGKKAVEQGDSVMKMNQDWHQEYQKKAVEEAMEKAKK